MNKFEKCKSCKKYDKIKSNENWIVCSAMPFDIMLNQGNTKNCEGYEQCDKDGG